MREIKFRGMMFSGEWVYGNVIKFDNHFFIFNGKMNTDGLYTTLEKYEVIPETIGQYTGLKDDYGEEIYEGDIVYWNPLVCVSRKDGEIRDDIYAEIIWCNNSAGFTFKALYNTRLRTLDMTTSKIFCNVHEKIQV